jgi:hypothetical protein
MVKNYHRKWYSCSSTLAGPGNVKKFLEKVKNLKMVMVQNLLRTLLNLADTN